MKKDMKVLVADDFKTMRRIIINILKQLGFTNIIEAENGKEAFEKAKSEKVDLIISDWNMPVMTGLDFLKAVRSDKELKDTPFLMVTAESEKSNVIEAIKAGVSNYIIKPFTAQTLKEKLSKILSK